MALREGSDRLRHHAACDGTAGDSDRVLAGAVRGGVRNFYLFFRAAIGYKGTIGPFPAGNRFAIGRAMKPINQHIRSHIHPALRALALVLLVIGVIVR